MSSRQVGPPQLTAPDPVSEWPVEPGVARGPRRHATAATCPATFVACRRRNRARRTGSGRTGGGPRAEARFLVEAVLGRAPSFLVEGARTAALPACLLRHHPHRRLHRRPRCRPAALPTCLLRHHPRRRCLHRRRPRCRLAALPTCLLRHHSRRRRLDRRCP